VRLVLITFFSLFRVGLPERHQIPPSSFHMPLIRRDLPFPRFPADDASSFFLRISYKRFLTLTLCLTLLPPEPGAETDHPQDVVSVTGRNARPLVPELPPDFNRT